MKTEAELRSMLEGVKQERSDCLSELNRCNMAHEDASGQYDLMLHHSKLPGFQRHTRHWHTARLQQAQDDIMICQKQLKAVQLQVDDILSQLDEHYHEFTLRIPSKSVRDALHPEQDLSWARRAHDHTLDRIDDAEAEQVSHAKVEDLLKVIWEREHDRNPTSTLDVEYRRRWKNAREASQSARSTFWQRSSELGTTYQWYDQARIRMQRWEERRRQNQKQQKPKTAPGFEEGRQDTYADRKQHRQQKSKTYYGYREKKPKTKAGQREQRQEGPKKEESGTYENAPQSQRISCGPTKSRTPSISIAQWRENVVAAFSDYAAMESFPTPPEFTCKELRCKNRKGRALEVCDCSIKKAFQHVENLKTERLKWHPDRFGICPEEKRGVFIKKTQEVFVIVSEMYEYQKNK